MPYTEVMHKFKHGQLHSGSDKGPKVTNRKQAIAIMLSEKRGAEHGKKEYQAHNKGGAVKFQAGGAAQEEWEPKELKGGHKPTPPPMFSPPDIGKKSIPPATKGREEGAPTRKLGPDIVSPKDTYVNPNAPSTTELKRGGAVKKYQADGSVSKPGWRRW